MSALELVRLVRESRLVPLGSLDNLLAAFECQIAESEIGCRAMADLLVKAKLLSSWQAGRLLNGSSDGFFLGRYKLLSRLGSGSMGVVYLAEHVRMRRRAALKILPPRFVKDPNRLELFYRESETTAALDHPNVVRAYDVDNEGETYYLVMEYVDGVNLQKLIDQEGPLDYARAAEYIRQAADGLSHAHERGIVHRDVKPANLMLDATGRIKILDMGLSHWEEVEACPTFEAPQIIGTPRFLAPETIRLHGSVEACSDIYSLGCTFYYLLAGLAPFGATSLNELLEQHASSPPPRPSEILDEFPPVLEEIYLRMMAKHPRDRFSNAAEVREAIADWQHEAFATPDSPASSAPGGRRVVLVAEDDAVTRQMLVMQLKKAGCEVRAASDGREAMSMLDADVTVCLFDWYMPGANGMECLRYAQGNFPETPVIILTASEDIQNAVVAMRDGAFDYLTKPCRIANVLSRIEEAVRTRTRSVEDGATLSALIHLAGTESTTIMDTVANQLLQRGEV